MKALIWIDWIIIAVIAVSTLISLKRGFVREALSLASWITAFVIARTFHAHLETLLAGFIHHPLGRQVAAFASLFIATLVVGAVISNMMARLIQITGLTGTDRALGMVFGLLRGVVLVVVAIALLRYTSIAQDRWWRQSVMIGNLAMVEQWSRRVLDDQAVEAIAPGKLSRQLKGVRPTPGTLMQGSSS